MVAIGEIISGLSFIKGLMHGGSKPKLKLDVHQFVGYYRLQNKEDYYDGSESGTYVEIECLIKNTGDKPTTIFRVDLNFVKAEGTQSSGVEYPIKEAKYAFESYQSKTPLKIGIGDAIPKTYGFYCPSDLTKGKFEYRFEIEDSFENKLQKDFKFDDGRVTSNNESYPNLTKENYFGTG
ncbi:MAG: hypothetical protein HZB67_00870 [Candidatus Aenigmarchaeota archaeon]|nr:hypothetical protein [Candidatus Aenigmarchaeota archaeon]MBI5224680.1 hypothetical protein [Candidatus Micrarchaeota archaeon]